MSIRNALAWAWAWNTLRHPVTILTWTRYADSTGFCMEVATELTADPVEDMWAGAYSGVTVTIDGWTCQISGGAEQLRRLADMLNDRAEACDSLTAALALEDGPR
jgi:hypothetical protein